MTWKPITKDEIQRLLATEVERLDDETRPLWDRFGITPLQVKCVRIRADGTPLEPEPIFVVAREGNEVVVFDDVEEEFGTGVLNSDGQLRNWGTYGERLDWTLRRFPESEADSGSLANNRIWTPPAKTG
jgi:hypothetical protein